MVPGPLPETSDNALLAFAARSIGHGLKHRQPLPVDLGKLDPAWTQERATFVTLKKSGDLRGCIGTVLPHRPLALDIAVNAFAAAFRDLRFQSVTEDELKEIEVSLSLLSPLAHIPVQTEDALRADLRPHIDGLVIQADGRRAVFLPQVWEQLPEPAAFVEHLKQKAGLGQEALPRGFKAHRFTVKEIGPTAYHSLSLLDDS